jgi:Tfp pilus assembly protein FimV
VGLKKAFKSWFLTEVSEIKESVSDLGNRAESALNKRESDLNSTSEERLEDLQKEIVGEDDPFAEARATIDAKVAEAEAREEMTEEEVKDAARQEVENAQTYAKRVDLDAEMDEAKAKASLDEAKAAERLAQIRKEMGSDPNS